ncbi:MAG: F0F1 ATP synthase subunit B [Anaerolineaceae bacterium]
MEALGINAGNLFVNLICFGIAFVLIARFIVGPIRRIMDDRKNIIEKGLADAQIASEAKQNAQAEAEKIIKEAHKKSDDILKEAHDEAASMKMEYRESIDRESAKDLDASREEIQKERDKILGNLRSQIIDISLNSAKKLVGESLLVDESKQHIILDELLTGLTTGKIIDISSLPVNQKRVEITTAIPLTAEEQKLVKEQLAEKMSDGSTITFLVDPKILGGMIIRSNEQLIDASVTGKSQHLKEALTR